MEDRFESLQENQKNEVLNFLQITGTEDINGAIHYMEMAQFDVANAVNLFFQNLEGGGNNNNSFNQPQRSSQQLLQQPSQPQSNRNQGQVNALDAAVKEYKKHLNRKMLEEDTGVISFFSKLFSATMNGVKNIWNSVIPVRLRGETAGGEEFRVHLRRQFPDLETYNFQNGTFQEVISQENTNTNYYLEQLKNSKSNFYMLMSEDDKIKTALKNRDDQHRIDRQNYINEQLFGFQPQPQQPTPSLIAAQQAQIQQDRLLREQQEEAFREAERQAERQERKKQEEQQKRIAEEERKKREEKERKELIEIKKNSLPNEPPSNHPDAFTFAFRVPDGSRIMRRFLKTHSIQCLFDFIDCKEEVEFESEERKFDLVQTFPPLSLLSQQNKSINEVFPDSVQEIIIVKEL